MDKIKKVISDNPRAFIAYSFYFIGIFMFLFFTTDNWSLGGKVIIAFIATGLFVFVNWLMKSDRR